MKLSLLVAMVWMAAPAEAAPNRPVLAPPPFEPKFMRDEQPPEPVSMSTCAKPVYPMASLRNEETGTVSLQFKVASNGIVLDAKVWRSSGFKDLDRSALSAMAVCKFRPATINGEPVQSFAYLSYVFTLE